MENYDMQREGKDDVTGPSSWDHMKSQIAGPQGLLCCQSEIPLVWKTTGNPRVLLPPPLGITLCMPWTRMREPMIKHQ